METSSEEGYKIEVGIDRRCKTGSKNGKETSSEEGYKIEVGIDRRCKTGSKNGMETSSEEGYRIEVGTDRRWKTVGGESALLDEPRVGMDYSDDTLDFYRMRKIEQLLAGKKHVIGSLEIVFFQNRYFNLIY